jgi:hypothetical protein
LGGPFRPRNETDSFNNGGIDKSRIAWLSSIKAALNNDYPKMENSEADFI